MGFRLLEGNEVKNKEAIISVLEILGITVIVVAIWLAFGLSAALAATGVALLMFAAALTRRR